MERFSVSISALFVIFCTWLFVDFGECKTESWDYMKFSQEWPPSVCMDSLHSNENNGVSDHACTIGKNVSTWTVHGLWPTQNTKEGPNYCNNTYKFNETALQTILPNLRKYWPNLFSDTKPDDFWIHEWRKHGTCALSLPALDSEFKYFSKGLELNQQYNLLKNYALAGIFPSETETYNITQLDEGLKQHYMYRPKISCIYVSSTQKQYVAQIALCLNKTFSAINCPSSRRAESSALGMYQLGSCRPNEPIYYPPFPSEQERKDKNVYFRPVVNNN